MCSCFSAYNLVIALPLILWLAYHIFPTTCWVPTINVLNVAIFPMLPKPAAQKLKKIWDSLMMSSRWAITPGRLPVVLWSRSTATLSRVFDLVFCKTFLCNKYFILRHWLFCIHFLNGMYVNLIPGRTYYEYSVWVLKPGMTEWYQSRVDHMNASLARSVVFWRLFYN
jgi:hypothetical protein